MLGLLLLLTQDRLLFEEDGIDPATVVVSPASRRVAYIRGGSMVIDGAASEPFDQVSRAFFSRDGSSIAYAATDGKAWYVIHDGKRSEAGSEIRDLGFLDDGRIHYRDSTRVVVGADRLEGYRVETPLHPLRDRVVFAARKGGKSHIVVDTTPGKEWDAVLDLSIGAGRYAAIVRDGSRERIVTSGWESEPVDWVAHLRFAPLTGALVYRTWTTGVSRLGIEGWVRGDGEELLDENALVPAVRAGKRDAQYVVHAGKRGKTYAEVRRVAWNRDGSVIAYAARDGQGWCVVHGSTERRVEGPIDEVALSPDGKTVAYFDGSHVVVGDRKFPRRFGEGLRVRPDGGSVAYGILEDHRKYRIAIDDGGTESFTQFFSYGFTPRGVFLAAGTIDQRTYVLQGSDRRGPFDRANPVFVGGVLRGYRAEVGGNVRLFDGDGEPPEFDAVDDVRETPDGKTLTYRARKGNRYVRVFAGLQSRPADHIGAPVRLTNDRVEFLSFEGRAVWWRVLERN